MTHRILVTGASIAGTALAWWLAEAGHDVTLVERAPAFRDGGQNVDVRGRGREVLRRMGLEAAALAAGTGEQGTRFVRADGSAVATFALDTSAKGTERTGKKRDGMTAEMEILRGDLARLLYDAARDRVAVRFGDRVTAADPATGAVTFASGATNRYDAVVVAEGVGSATRDLVLPGAADPRWMDMVIAYLTIPRTAGDDRFWRWYHATGKRSVSLRPDAHGTTRAMLIAHRRPGTMVEWPVAQQKRWLHDRFADAGWEAPRILAGVDGATDFYFEVLRQMRLPRWSTGRVALTGDAAWCITPLGGQGATLALVGAYVLAGELGRSTDLAAAFAAYERVMRPIVTAAQGTPKLLPRLLHPQSRLGVGLLRSALGLAGRPSVMGVLARFGGGGEEETLPDYARAAALGGGAKPPAYT